MTYTALTFLKLPTGFITLDMHHECTNSGDKRIVDALVATPHLATMAMNAIHS